MKKLLLNIFIFFGFIIFLWNSLFANIEEDKKKTIKELKYNIEVLKSKKVINFSIFEKFKQTNGKLVSYFSKNLSEKDLLEIEKIITNYNFEKNNIQIKFKSENKNLELIKLKEKLYNELSVFIDVLKIDLYKDFVSRNIETLKKWVEIKKDIENKEKIVEEKVSTIKERIEENHKKEKEKLNILLKNKIKNKIINFKNSERIQNLWVEKQRILFKIVLKKIIDKKEKTTNITEKQMNLYTILEKVLEEVINEL